MTRKFFRRHLRIRRWLTLAVAVGSLGFASSAPALPLDEGGGSGAVQATPVQRIVAQEQARSRDLGVLGVHVKAPVAVTTGGFDWGDAAIGAGIALGAAFGGAGIVLLGRNRTRSRLAAQL